MANDSHSTLSEKSAATLDKINDADPTSLATSCSLESAEAAEPEDAGQLPGKETGLSTSISRQTTGPPYSIFSKRTKMFILVMVSFSSLISPFGATTFYPSLDILAKDLHVTPSLINLSLTTYMVSLLA